MSEGSRIELTSTWVDKESAIEYINLKEHIEGSLNTNDQEMAVPAQLHTSEQQILFEGKSKFSL